MKQARSSVSFPYVPAFNSTWYSSSLIKSKTYYKSLFDFASLITAK